MNLLDLPPGFDDPVATLLGFHRRIERQLAALGHLPCRLEVNGIDAVSAAAAASILDFFSGAIAIHHADEEELLPVLEMRAAGRAEREAIGDLREHIVAEHREMDRTWRSLRRPLEGIAEGMNRNLPCDLIQYFRACHATHISAEEAGLHLSAARRLLPSDRATLGRGMAVRRTRKYRFQ